MDDNKKLFIVAGAGMLGMLVIGIAVGLSLRSTPAATAAAVPVAVPPRVLPVPPSAAAPAAPSAPAAPGDGVGTQPSRPETDEDIARQLAALAPESWARAICAIEARANPAVTGAALARNAARYEGEVVTFSGEVYEVQDLPNGGTFLRIGFNGSEHVVAAVAPVQPPDSVLANARVRVWGRMAGTFSYTSQAGWNITIPKLVAYAVYPRREAPNCARLR